MSCLEVRMYLLYLEPGELPSYTLGKAHHHVRMNVIICRKFAGRKVRERHMYQCTATQTWMVLSMTFTWQLDCTARKLIIEKLKI